MQPARGRVQISPTAEQRNWYWVVVVVEVMVVVAVAPVGGLEGEVRAAFQWALGSYTYH